MNEEESSDRSNDFQTFIPETVSQSAQDKVVMKKKKCKIPHTIQTLFAPLELNQRYAKFDDRVLRHTILVSTVDGKIRVFNSEIA